MKNFLEANRPTNTTERDALIFGDKAIHWMGGVEHYNGLDHQTLQTLVDKGFASRSDRQNDAPELGDILDFLKANPKFRAHGYVVSGERSDCRVSIEGVDGYGLEQEDVNAFIDMFRDADEFEHGKDRCYCWYD